MSEILSQFLDRTGSTYSSAPLFDPNWCFDAYAEPKNFDPDVPEAWTIDAFGLIFSGPSTGAWSFRFRELNFDEPDFFGQPAFVARSRNGLTRSFLPELLFLNKQGKVALDLVPDGRLALLLSHYVRDWPEHLRILVGHTRDGCHGPLMIDLLSRRPELLDVARQSPGFFFETTRLALHRLAFLDATAFADALLHTRRHILIGSLLRARVAKRHVAALERLAFDIDAKARDQFWITACEDARFEVFLHAKVITPELIAVAALVPTWALHSNPKFGRYVDADMHDMIAKATEARGDGYTLYNFSREVAKVRSRPALRTFLRKCAEPVELPPPPIPPRGCLKPISTMKELWKAAQRFHNCAASYASDIADGRAYLYILEQTRPIMVLIQKDENEWWFNSAEYAEGVAVGHRTAARIRKMIDPVNIEPLID